MVCIYCGSDTQVINSRLQKQSNQVWRRRKCLQCGAIFSTHEAAAYDAAWRVRTAQSGLQPFQRLKLLISLHKSLEHRKTALTDATALTDTIMGKLLRAADRGTLEPEQIAFIAYEVLQRFDAAAAVHYKAFHSEAGI